MASFFSERFLVSGDLADGHTGPGVEDLQDYLTLLGYLDSSKVSTRGVFDQHTKTALEKFQTFFKLPVTGRLDKVTRHLMRQPRCGEPDTGPKIRAFSNPWGKNNLSFCTQNVDNDPELDTADKILAGLYEGFSVWSQACPVRFHPTSDGNQCDIKFWFGGPQCGGIACTSSPPGSTMRFDPQQSWARSNPTPPGYVDFVAFAIHECGHALGLGHSPNESSIMYPTIPNGKRQLSQEDIADIQSIYGSNLLSEALLDFLADALRSKGS